MGFVGIDLLVFFACTVMGRKDAAWERGRSRSGFYQPR